MGALLKGPVPTPHPTHRAVALAQPDPSTVLGGLLPDAGSMPALDRLLPSGSSQLDGEDRQVTPMMCRVARWDLVLAGGQGKASYAGARGSSEGPGRMSLLGETTFVGCHPTLVATFCLEGVHSASPDGPLLDLYSLPHPAPPPFTYPSCSAHISVDFL